MNPVSVGTVVLKTIRGVGEFFSYHDKKALAENFEK